MSLHRIARFAGRPLLMTPDAALVLAQRALAIDPRALGREGFARRPSKFLSLGGIASMFNPPRAEWDDEFYDNPPADPKPTGYAPSYAGAPELEGFGWSLVDGIACLSIEGALLDRGFYACGEMFWGYDTIAQALGEAMAESRVRGVFVRMHSPGGVVAGGLEALTADIRAWREAGNAGGKPIFVYADCAASAAYWIGAQADRIFAPAVGMVGSIGAVIVHEDYSERLKKEGVKVTPIQFGAKKTDGAWFKELSESALADLQAEIDAIGVRFIADVTRGREMLGPSAMLGMQAACFMAEHPEAERSGLALGLVDEIAREEAAFAALRAHIGNPVSATRRAPAPAKAASPETGAQESDMRKSTNARLRAALDRKAMSEEEKLDAIRKILDDEDEKAEGEEEETTAEGDEEETTAEDEQEETTAEEEEEETEAEDEEEEKSALKTAQAILALPEAKGREQLAQKLAFTAGMSVKTAKDLLAAAPKASRLVGNVIDPKLGAGGEGGPGASAPQSKQAKDDVEAAKFIRECHELATGRKAKA